MLLSMALTTLSIKRSLRGRPRRLAAIRRLAQTRTSAGTRPFTNTTIRSNARSAGTSSGRDLLNLRSVSTRITGTLICNALKCLVAGPIVWPSHLLVFRSASRPLRAGLPSPATAAPNPAVAVPGEISWAHDPNHRLDDALYKHALRPKYSRGPLVLVRIRAGRNAR